MNGNAIPLSSGEIDQLADRIADALAEKMENQEPYLSVEQAADYLAAKPKRLYDLAESGRLHTYRDGRRLLFRREDLDRYLSGGT